MKIIKVIVDELPKTCGECPYALVDDWADDEDGLVYFCSAMPVLPDNVKDNSLGDIVLADHCRPDWCPLEDQGGFIIDDPVLAKLILNREGAFYNKPKPPEKE